MVEVRVLGDLEVQGADGSVAPLTAEGPLRVLSHLAVVSPGIAWAESLVDALWPVDPPPTHRAALRNTVSRLRRLLRDPENGDPIISRDLGYQLAETVSIDAHRLERAVVTSRSDERPAVVLDRIGPVLDLRRGPAYANLADHPFDPERARLDSLYVEALEKHQRALIALARGEEGLGRLLNVVADHPFNEGLIELLMITQYLAGAQHEALQLYETTRRRLRDELGLEPSPRLSAMQLAILQHRPTSEVLSLGHVQAVDISGPMTAPSPIVGQAVAASLTANPDQPSPATNGVTGSAPAGRQRVDVLSRRAESSSFLGHFAEAAADYLAAVSEAKASDGDALVVGRLCLRLATITWEPDLAAKVSDLIDEVLDALLASPDSGAHTLAAELRICRAGGLFRSGVEGVFEPDVEGLSEDLALIERDGSASELVWATTRYRNGLAGLISADESLALTATIDRPDVVDPLLVGHNDRAVFVDSLRAGDRATALRRMRSMAARQTATEPAVNRFGLVTASTCWDLAIGHFWRAQRSLTESLSYRGQLASHTLDQVILGQSFWLTREIGDPAAVETHLEAAIQLAASDPSTPLWAIGASLLAADLGQLQRADELINDANDRFDLLTLPAGSHRLPILGLGAETLAVIARPDNRKLADGMHRLLAEASDVGVLVGWPVLFLGSKERFLGFAALAGGDPDRADQHFERALAEDRWMPALYARSLAASAQTKGGVEAGRRLARATAIKQRLLSRLTP